MIAALLSVVLAPPVRSWPMYQFNPAHNAVFTSSPLRVAWKVHLGGKINGGISIVGDNLYVESFAKRLYALDVRNGAIHWEQPLPSVAMNAPIVTDGHVIVGTGSNHTLFDTGKRVVWGVPGGDRILSYNAQRGIPEWQHPTIGEDMPTAVALRDGNDTAVIFSNGDGHVRSLDLQTGKQIWDTTFPGIATMGSLNTDGRYVYGSSLGSPNAYMKAFLTHDQAALANMSWTWAIDPPSGKLVWIVPYGSGDASPTLGDGVVLEETAYPSSHHDSTKKRNVVYGLDAKTGRLLWEYRGAPGVLSTVATNEEAIAGLYSDQRFYQALPFENQFDAFVAHTGQLLWSLHTKAPVKMSAIESHGTLYFGDVGGTLYAVDAATGHVLAEHSFPNPFSCSPPVIVGRTLFIANGGEIHALPLDKI
jgi:outer membrane protein assembly factor BamB